MQKIISAKMKAPRSLLFIGNEKDELMHFLFSLPFALRAVRSLVLQIRLILDELPVVIQSILLQYEVSLILAPSA